MEHQIFEFGSVFERFVRGIFFLMSWREFLENLMRSRDGLRVFQEMVEEMKLRRS